MLNGAVKDNRDSVKSLIPVYPDSAFKVTVYAPKCTYHGASLPARVMDAPLNALREKGTMLLSSFNHYSDLYFIVSPTAGLVDYSFGVTGSRAT